MANADEVEARRSLSVASCRTRFQMQGVNRIAIEAAISTTKKVTSTRLTEIEVISQWFLNGMRFNEARPTSLTRNHATNTRRTDSPCSNRATIADGACCRWEATVVARSAIYSVLHRPLRAGPECLTLRHVCVQPLTMRRREPLLRSSCGGRALCLSLTVKFCRLNLISLNSP